MNYKIKQLKNIRDCDYAFEWWDWAKDQFSLNDYEVVYEGELNPNNNKPEAVLDTLFEIFNISRPEDFKGHSLSVSDVVELDGVNYYCDSVGWVKVD